MTEHWSERFVQEIKKDKTRPNKHDGEHLTNVHTCLRRTDQEVSTGAAGTAVL